MIDANVLLVLLVVVLIFNSAITLWTSLLAGSILFAWYRQRCIAQDTDYITPDTGVETGAYVNEETERGMRQRRVKPDDAEIDEEAKEAARAIREQEEFKWMFNPH